MSVTGGITVGSVSRSLKVTGLIRALVVRIVHGKSQLAEDERFSPLAKCYGAYCINTSKNIKILKIFHWKLIT